MKQLSIGLALLLSLSLSAATAARAWNANDYSQEDTLDFYTSCGKQGDHWSRVWLVVLDGQMYVRLGSRAAERVDCNTEKPYVSVRIAGEEFPKVRFEEEPEMADRVAEAMHDKYWSDFAVSWMDHPYTMRLSVEE